jgi:hypothetical protein
VTYTCDRKGGPRANRSREWTCPHCGTERHHGGHHCQRCRRRVCCLCYDHDAGACRTAEGSAVRPELAVAAACPGRKAPARTDTRLSHTKKRDPIRHVEA